MGDGGLPQVHDHVARHQGAVERAPVDLAQEADRPVHPHLAGEVLQLGQVAGVVGPAHDEQDGLGMVRNHRREGLDHGLYPLALVDDAEHADHVGGVGQAEVAAGHRPVPPRGTGVGVGHPHHDRAHAGPGVFRLELAAGAVEGHDHGRAAGCDAPEHGVGVEELLAQGQGPLLRDGVEAAQGEVALQLGQLGAEALPVAVQLGVGVEQVAPRQVVEDDDPGMPAHGVVHVPMEERSAELVDHRVEPGLGLAALEGGVLVDPVAGHEVDVGQEAVVHEHLDLDLGLPGQSGQQVDGVVGDPRLLRGQGRPHRQPPARAGWVPVGRRLGRSRRGWPGRGPRW